MAKTVIVGCRLPNGIILELPGKPEVKVAIKGMNSVTINGALMAGHAETIVEEEFWNAWLSKNKDFAALSSGALFANANPADLADMAKDNKKRKTGFDKLTKDDEKESGVKDAKEE